MRSPRGLEREKQALANDEWMFLSYQGIKTAAQAVLFLHHSRLSPGSNIALYPQLLFLDFLFNSVQTILPLLYTPIATRDGEITSLKTIYFVAGLLQYKLFFYSFLDSAKFIRIGYRDTAKSF